MTINADTLKSFGVTAGNNALHFGRDVAYLTAVAIAVRASLDGVATLADAISARYLTKGEEVKATS